MQNDVFQKRMQKLNTEQKIAVETLEGPVLVIAGPGTGKSELLSMRVANILDKTDTLASSILCLTFTDSAAINMRKRLQSIIGDQAYKIAIHTFHSFGTEIINQNPEYFFFGAGYSVADELAKIDILEKILLSLDHNNPLCSRHPDIGWTYLKDIQQAVQYLKQGGVTAEDFALILEDNQNFLQAINPLFEQIFDLPKITNLVKEDWFNFYDNCQIILQNCLRENTNFIQDRLCQNFAKSLEDLNFELENKFETKKIKIWRDKKGSKNKLGGWHLKDFLRHEKNLALQKVYAKYQEELHKNRLFDFDDMLLEVSKSFEQNPDLKFNLQERFLYILVDEFQDTNGVQMRLLGNLLNLEITENQPNIFVVGDDDQSIYKFQGASLSNMLGFDKIYDKVKIVTLTKNYRSNQEILDFAKQIIEQSQERLTNISGIEKNLISMVSN
jgi:DNA helicase-2/ATP-dependent DNA helicase PcrA